MRLGVDGLVRFHGFQSNVADWMASTDCVILPSRWEGLPFVLLEAGRLACAVICSDASGNIDVADHGRCATLFRNGDALDLAAKLSQYIARSECGSLALNHMWNGVLPQMLQLGAVHEHTSGRTLTVSQWVTAHRSHSAEERHQAPRHMYLIFAPRLGSRMSAVNRLFPLPKKSKIAHCGFFHT